MVIQINEAGLNKIVILSRIVFMIHTIFFCLQTKKLPKFLHKGMDQMFMEEINSQIQMLMHNLDCLPVSSARGAMSSSATGRPSGFSTVLRTKK